MLIGRLPERMEMINIEEIEKRWLRVGELLDVAGKSLEILALYASEDEYQPPFECDKCPLRLKGICVPMHPGKSCFELWLNYLEGKDEEA